MPLISSQLSAAIAAMRALLPLEYPADAIIRRFFRDNAILGVQDRAFIAEVVFGVLRHRFFLEHLANPITPRALVLAYLVKFHGLNLREFDTLASESEKKWLAEIKAIKIDSFPLAVQAEFPDWLVEKLQNTLSDEQILELGLALQKPAPLDLRVNTFLSKREEVMDALQQEGIEAQVTPYSPCGIRLVGKPMINRHALFLSGKIEVQDEGSQLLGYLLAPKRGEMVVDFCAGAGGKALLLGALMNSKGRLYAFDVSEKRLSNLTPRFKRSGLSNLHVQRINDENDSKVKRLSGKIDRVLVDAPCSGIGTLRRNPDLKWRQSPQSIEELKIKQRDILASAARLLKPGGRLVYATCSFLREENQDIINSFLEKNPQFTVLNATELLSQQKIALDTGEFLQINPQQHQTDGFFAAALQRNT
ncbi:MAG TPA: RsmB/NOP family class I SAM-dependent RNA methyltransferase [Nitrosomonas sp.]|nr:RsmB/NOP family class I SAM-dependent RNA methyltransferase [Nitrosomonas sp.]HRB32047.1 RsmB/NOP family class I SAM-dependent RNA methyltransferase [Nitrosomonas sp.]HRB45503.1 RsmB/NOP family class I SAM-dependent RNA methyltransferase [Nitrosomonas sp.]HRB76981.1 RsmB/NOP family class I SAM-dependent RNA methyltransferase [Nitrosomonas sp.]